MRTLFLLRGAPGSGKSTWVRENNLEPYTLSADNIRLMFTGPVLNTEGNFEISQKNDGKVWDLLLELLESRMQNGEFVIVDATHYKSTLLNNYKKLTSKYRYRQFVVDFTNVPIEIAMERNNKRDEYKKVPSATISKMYAVFESDTEVSKRFTVLSPEEAVNKLKESLLFDYNQYEKVVVFGDIHGCYEPLKHYFEENPINDKTSYIFLGDYIDRGIQNKEVLEFLLKIKDNKNVLLLEGNHERWLRMYANDEDSVIPVDRELFKPLRKLLDVKQIMYKLNANKIRSKEFLDNTLQQIKDLDKKDLRQLCSRFGQMAYFLFNNKEYFVCHGGIPTLPSIFVSSEEMIKGVGNYEYVQVIYNSWHEKYSNPDDGRDKVLIHGHRNVFHFKPNPEENIYNLCSDVEFGEPLRILEITKDGEVVKEYENPVFNEELVKRKKEMEVMPVNTKNVLLEQLNNSKLVTKKTLSDNIVSYNFSRNCFYRREWNDLTCTARGLFVDIENDKVVCRSYNKFFNWGEVEDTKSKNLVNILKFPVKAYKKENGFLALISYNARRDELLVCSKSTNEGEYVGYIRNVLKMYTEKELEAIKQYVKENDCTLVCECVDNENDPHIISYVGKHLFLLDIIKNDLVCQKLPYDEVFKVSRELNMEVKHLEYTFNTFEDLHAFKKAQDVSYDVRHEGWVFEDANGYMVKYKTRFYHFWKMMRKIKEEISHNHNLKKTFVSEDEIRVSRLLKKLDEEGKLDSMSIIDVEKLYYSNPEEVTQE